MSDNLHIVFGRLAEDVLRAALASAAQFENIATFPDDLSCGPLDSFDGATRQAWIQESLYLDPKEWGVFPLQLPNFFHTVNSRDSKIIFWVCWHSAYEFCGFYNCVRQLTVNDLYYVDTMKAAQYEDGGSSDDGFPPRLAHISPIIAAHLLGQESRISALFRAEQLQKWQRLRTENAPLRTIDVQGVQSVPLSHFDPFLLAFVAREWQSARWVVAQAAVQANNGNFFRVDMMTLTGRLRALVKEGRLEADKDIADPALSVRLR
jgi:hypothetical protein